MRASAAVKLEFQAASQAPSALPASFASVPILLLIGMVISIAETFALLKAVLLRGLFVDTDDAMRLSQVRAFMQGQGWYDLTARQLDPPTGVVMHWSRLVDVPIALLLRFFGLFSDPIFAERLTRISFPLLLLGMLFWLFMRIGRQLVGEIGPLLAMVFLALSSAPSGYFQPGRLDHDHISVVLLTSMVLCLLRALDGERLWAALAGLSVATQLAVSLETLPFVVVGVAILPCAWIIKGEVYRAPLQAFAAALLVGFIGLFPVVVAPADWFEGACDTYSMAHLIGGGTGALLCCLLALSSPKLLSLHSRLIAAVAAGGLTILAVKLTYPACLGDPYVGVDPVLRTIWLQHVTEAEPLLHQLAHSPNAALKIILPLAIGLLGLLAGAFQAQGVARGRWLTLAAITMAGIATCFWEVRAYGEVEPIVLLGALWFLARFAGPLFADGKAYAGPLMVGAAIALSPAGFALALPSPKSQAPHKSSKICREDASFITLNSLPYGIAVTPIDTGAFIMARTKLGVLAAPFHRDARGIRAIIDTFSNPPNLAEAFMRRSGAHYLIYCGTASGFEMFKSFGDTSLAASLARDEVPAWLKPMPLNSPYKVFELAR